MFSAPASPAALPQQPDAPANPPMFGSDATRAAGNRERNKASTIIGADPRSQSVGAALGPSGKANKTLLGM